MRKSRKYLCVIFGAVELIVLLTALTRPAYGYVDPGSGLLAIQVGGSMLAGGLFMLRSKIRKLLGITPQAEETSQESQPAEPSN